MNEMIKTRDSRKRVLGLVASLLACFALVMALVPMQAIADNGGQDDANAEAAASAEPAAPADSSDAAAVADSADAKEVAIPSPAANLIYTGAAQKLLPTPPRAPYHRRHPTSSIPELRISFSPRPPATRSSLARKRACSRPSTTRPTRLPFWLPMPAPISSRLR